MRQEFPESNSNCHKKERTSTKQKTCRTNEISFNYQKWTNKRCFLHWFDFITVVRIYVHIRANQKDLVGCVCPVFPTCPRHPTSPCSTRTSTRTTISSLTGKIDHIAGEYAYFRSSLICSSLQHEVLRENKWKNLQKKLWIVCARTPSPTNPTTNPLWVMRGAVERWTF